MRDAVKLRCKRIILEAAEQMLRKDNDAEEEDMLFEGCIDEVW